MKTGMLFLTLMTLTFISAESMAAQKKRILITVGDIKNNKSPLWKKKTCEQLFTLANNVVEAGADVTCRSFDTRHFLDKELTSQRDSFDFHMRITNNSDDTVSMDVTKLHRVHDTDFATLGWKFKDGEIQKSPGKKRSTKPQGISFTTSKTKKPSKQDCLSMAFKNQTMFSMTRKMEFSETN